MKRIFWIITLFGSGLGVLMLLATLFFSDGAPQEAAGAAISVAFAVIPYCLARAISEMEIKGDEANEG
jgi:hypothetical protein